MSEGMEELARRLVVGRKRDGRAVYDEQAKAELVAACTVPGASVSRLARECGINANQLSRWLREHDERRRRDLVAPTGAAPTTFVPVTIGAERAPLAATAIGLQACLPNGVVIDLQGSDLAQTAQLIEVLGRLRCSASTNG
jgi:transposase